MRELFYESVNLFFFRSAMVKSVMATAVMLPSATLMQVDNDNYLKIYPLRKGRRERERVMRASRDPRVYILTPLYTMKGTPPAGHSVSGAGNKENMEEKTGGDREENKEETGHKVKRGGTRKTKKKKKKKSNFQEEDPWQRIIIPTLDRSAQVRKRIILKLCTLPTNLMITFLSLLFWKQGRLGMLHKELQSELVQT